MTSTGQPERDATGNRGRTRRDDIIDEQQPLWNNARRRKLDGLALLAVSAELRTIVDSNQWIHHRHLQPFRESVRHEIGDVIPTFSTPGRLSRDSDDRIDLSRQRCCERGHERAEALPSIAVLDRPNEISPNSFVTEQHRCIGKTEQHWHDGITERANARRTNSVCRRVTHRARTV